MTTATPDHARAEWPCPLGRTFGKTHDNCIAERCPVWRWVPLSAADPRFVKEVQKAMKEQNLSHQKAVAHVMENRADLGLPTKPEVGRCGLGGEVKA